MKVEITHDILAQKVFAKLDGEKKELLEIQGLIENRCEKDSLLNRKEMKQIKPFLSKIKLNDKQEKFIKRSRNNILTNSATNWSILIFPIIFFLLFQSNKNAKLREEREQLLSSYIVAKFDNNEKEALTKLEGFLAHPLSRTENVLPFYMEMAQLYKSAGLIDSAEIKLQQAIDLSASNRSKLYYQVKKVQFYLEIDKIEKAREVLASLSGDSTDNSNIQNPFQIKEKIANLLLTMGEPEEAKRVYDAMLHPLPDTAEQIKIYAQRSVACLNLDSINQAVTDYIQALRFFANPLVAALSTTDSSFVSFPNKMRLNTAIKQQIVQLNSPPDSIIRLALDRLLVRLDPINGIRTESFTNDSILVFDLTDSIRFQVNRNQIFYGGKKRVESHSTLPHSIRRVLAAASAADLDAVNTLNNNLAFGPFQWNIGLGDGSGELPALLRRIKQKSPSTFQHYFGQYNLDVSADTNTEFGYLVLNNQRRDSSHLKEVFHSPEWAFVFWKATQDSIVIEAELEQMKSRLNKILYTNVKGTSISELVTSEFGIAVLLAYSLVRPSDIRRRMNKAIDVAGDDLSDQNIIDQFITSWKKDMGNATDIEFRIQKIRNRKLRNGPNSFNIN